MKQGHGRFNHINIAYNIFSFSCTIDSILLFVGKSPFIPKPYNGKQDNRLLQEGDV